jgi:hypothetical protein
MTSRSWRSDSTTFSSGGHDARTHGYGTGMSQMGDHERERPVEMEGVPEGEEIAPGDAAERVDEDPEEQPNRHDPVWDDEAHED